MELQLVECMYTERVNLPGKKNRAMGEGGRGLHYVCGDGRMHSFKYVVIVVIVLFSTFSSSSIKLSHLISF